MIQLHELVSEVTRSFPGNCPVHGRMSRFTSVETERVLSLLGEAIEKLQLLATIPLPSKDAASHQLAASALKRLRAQLDTDAAFALENQAEHTVNNQGAAKGLHALAGQVAAVRDRVRTTLSTSVEEDEVHRVLLSDMKVRIREAEHDYKQMVFEVRAQHEARETASRQNLKKILALKTELHDIHHGTEQANALIDQGSKQTEFALHNTYEEDNVRLREEASQLSTAQLQVQDQHHYIEAGHRKKQLKGAVELGNLIEKYDTDMETIQATIDEVRAASASDVAEIERLAQHFAIMDENDRRTAADAARWEDERKAREWKELKFFTCIAKIQARFRGYRTRCLLKAQHKKKKKKRKKGGKSPKKGVSSTKR
ncbi:hypothetical protein ACHHYP_06892 [Achlya hypogyna]|uniref:Dynein regulatory complex protein 10 n=1 Tax=Achlya hypogyna TaxID=1202772 RepID=A0A1V9YRY0_ACHHY|nr:hypothetical protein ACHHYP_06892 [Achlya hypogyna]